MAKILLIQPPLTADELYARGSNTSASLIPPLGIAYIASYLQKYGHECRIIDGIAEPLPLEKICRIARDYDIIGITVVSTYAVRAIELIRALKKSKSSQHIVVGYPLTSLYVTCRQSQPIVSRCDLRRKDTQTIAIHSDASELVEVGCEFSPIRMIDPFSPSYP